MRQIIQLHTDDEKIVSAYPLTLAEAVIVDSATTLDQEIESLEDATKCAAAALYKLNNEKLSKEEADAVYAKADDLEEAEYVTSQALNNINIRVDSISGSVESKADIEDVYTKEEADERFITSGDVYTKEETDETFATKQELYDVEEVVSYSLNDLNTRVEEVSGSVESKADAENVYTKSESDDRFTTKEYIDEIELVASQALNDLNTRVNAVSGSVESKADANSVYTKEEADDRFVTSGDVVDVEYVISQSLNDLNTRLNAVSGSVESKADINDVYTKSETYTKEETDDNIEIAVESSIGVISGAVEELREDVDTIDTVTSRSLVNLDGRISELSSKTESELATISGVAESAKETVDDMRSDFDDLVEDYSGSSRAVAGALIDLDTRIKEISGNTSDVSAATIENSEAIVNFKDDIENGKKTSIPIDDVGATGDTWVVDKKWDEKAIKWEGTGVVGKTAPNQKHIISITCQVGDTFRVVGTHYNTSGKHSICATYINNGISSTSVRRTWVSSGNTPTYYDIIVTIEDLERNLKVSVTDDTVVYKKYKSYDEKISDISTEVALIKEGKPMYERLYENMSYEFVARITPFTNDTNKKACYFYCIPDIHTNIEVLDYHKYVIINSKLEQEGINNRCRYVISAGDFLYPKDTITGNTNIVAQVQEYAEKIIQFDNECAYTTLLPALGGHDFNNVSDNNSQDDTLENNLTKWQQKSILIYPCASRNSSVAGGRTFWPNGDTGGTKCYYLATDTLFNRSNFYIVLDETDHPNIVVGTYNGEQTYINLTSVDFTNNTFNGTILGSDTSVSNVPFGDFVYEYSRYKCVSYQQDQLQWLIDTLNSSSATSATNFVVINHSGANPNQESGSGAINDIARTRKAVYDILNAFKNRTTYTGSDSDASGHFTWSVTADFTNAKGNLVGLFKGHAHACNVVQRGSFYEFNSDCAGAQSNSNGTTNLFDRTSGDLFRYYEGKVYRYHFGRRGKAESLPNQEIPFNNRDDYSGTTVS